MGQEDPISTPFPMLRADTDIPWGADTSLPWWALICRGDSVASVIPLPPAWVQREETVLTQEFPVL